MRWNGDAHHVDNAMENVGSRPPEPEADEYRVVALWRAACVLRDEVRRLRRDADRLRAQTTAVLAREQMALVDGEPLVAGQDDGGFRHFLAGERVPNGTGLRLLTSIGWLPGAYESQAARNGGEEREPWFYFVLPGHEYALSIPITREARLAWPSEFGERPW